MQTVKCHAMQGFKGPIFFCKQRQQVIYDGTYFLKLDWCSHGFCILKRFEFFLLFVLISFYLDVILNILFFGGIAGQIHILF